MSETFLHGLIAGYGIAIPVGAIAVLIMDTAMRRGFRHGFAAGAGAATADLVYAALAVGAGGLLVPLLRPLAPLLGALSGLVLVVLAGSGFLSLRRGMTGSGALEPAGSGAPTFARFFALTLVNPLTVVYFTAMVLGGGWADGGVAALVVFTAGAFLASLSWQTLLAVAGTTIGATMPPSMRVATGALGNTVVLSFGILALTRT